jgi:hypothetical protein
MHTVAASLKEYMTIPGRDLGAAMSVRIEWLQLQLQNWFTNLRWRDGSEWLLGSGSFFGAEAYSTLYHAVLHAIFQGHEVLEFRGILDLFLKGNYPLGFDNQDRLIVLVGE